MNISNERAISAILNGTAIPISKNDLGNLRNYSDEDLQAYTLFVLVPSGNAFLIPKESTERGSEKE
jgi:hypothetical protein